ncbi:signal transduction protein [Enterovibrio norvegicus]|uniref:EAL and HDOD domain-containing protein n=1 Tax=Enterovibrio norvegicus TaxID=188144 RepID=UPI0002FC8EAE|nr:EAL domain-containing protein [Enterovibrio norvegicus]OEF51453.1 signal transduction protein [Enterovibrio norvegicus]
MSSNIARQAIFNRQNQRIGYELLFRDGRCDTFPLVAAEYATEIVLNDLFVSGKKSVKTVSDGQPCFVNFSYQSLINGTALNYPPKDLVIEVLENCVPDTVLFDVLVDLKSRGYRIAFDDFNPCDAWRPFLPLADIVKIDFRALSRETISRFVLAYKSAPELLLLAEKIETAEELLFARKLGFDLFQGYQLSKPERIPFSGVIEHVAEHVA